jgi:signal transduction histidine kinase
LEKTGHILAVDDDRPVLALLGRILGRDYELTSARSGEEALDRFDPQRHELVLLDVSLGGIDGYETCRRMRARREGQRAKIMMVSAHDELDARLRGYEAGADDYVVKPFHAEEMLAKVKVLMRLHDVEVFERLRSRFLNLLAHETRTPLSGLLGPAQLLAEDIDLDQESRQEMAQIILESARSLNQIVDRAVLLCAFKVGEAVSLREGLDLVRVTRDVVHRLRKEVADGDPCIELRAPSHLTVIGDEGHLAFVVETLVDNALRYRFPGTVVRVDLDRAGDRFELTVTNEGSGIEPDRLPRIFDGLEVQDLDARSGKLGLNLALSREIVHEHGGEIEVDSRPGAYTRFAVSIPLEATRTEGVTAVDRDVALALR